VAVTSLEQESERHIAMATVRKQFQTHFQAVFALDLEPVDSTGLRRVIDDRASERAK
jgi:hypothetical protein